MNTCIINRIGQGTDYVLGCIVFNDEDDQPTIHVEVKLVKNMRDRTAWQTSLLLGISTLIDTVDLKELNYIASNAPYIVEFVNSLRDHHKNMYKQQAGNSLVNADLMRAIHDTLKATEIAVIHLTDNNVNQLMLHTLRTRMTEGMEQDLKVITPSELISKTQKVTS